MKIWFVAGGLALAAALAYFGHALSQARRSLREAQTAAASAGQFAYRLHRLDAPAPSGFETISAPAQFRDASLFGGRLYVAAASGLFAYDAGGQLAARFRAGLELPAAPLTAAAPGLGANSAPPELWIATAGEGLLAFDGARFTQIRPEDAGARALTAVLPVSSGRILLGTEKRGVLAWDGKALTQLHPALAGFHVTALAGTEADLWIGSVERGALRWHAGQLDRFSEAEGLPDAQVLSLAVGETTPSSPGAAYVGTALGVAEFRDGRFTRALAEGFLASALMARRETLFIGSLDEGVAEVSLAARTPRPRLTGAPAQLGAVEKILTLDGRIYALTESGLLERSAQGGGFRETIARPGATLADGNISALALDRAGRLWVGYFDRGLDVLEPGFERARHVENDRVFCVNRIAHSGDGGLTAAATANGLALFDGAGQPKQVLGKADGLISNSVTDVLLRGDSRSPSITVATPAGVTTIDAGGASSLYAFHGLVNNHAYALAAYGARTLVGTLGGLSIVDSGVVNASFTTANSGLKHNWVTALAAVPDGWFIGTYGAGVVKLGGDGRWTAFPDMQAPVAINPNAMAATDAAVYAGTLGNGMAVYNRGSGRWTLARAGLPSMNVTAIAAGGGYVYAGTDNGLVRILERALGVQ